eukprot:RCo005866
MLTTPALSAAFAPAPQTTLVVTPTPTKGTTPSHATPSSNSHGHVVLREVADSPTGGAAGSAVVLTTFQFQPVVATEVETEPVEAQAVVYMPENNCPAVKCLVPHCSEYVLSCWRHTCPHCGAVKSSKTPTCGNCKGLATRRPPSVQALSEGPSARPPLSMPGVWIPHGSIAKRKMMFETQHSALFRCTYDGIPAMQKLPTKNHDPKALFKEWELHTMVDRHPNILRVYGLSRSPSGEVSMLTELLDCDLTDRLSQLPQMVPPEELLPTLAFYMLQAARGLLHIHRCGLLHRDVGTNNLLLDGKLLVKVSDFGLARRQNDLSPTGLPYPLSTPPEALRSTDDSSVWTTKCDAWQFGLMLCDVLSLGRPSLGEFNYNVQALLDALDHGWLPERPKLCSDGWWALVVQCLRQDPLERPEFEEIVERIEVLSAETRARPLAPGVP